MDLFFKQLMEDNPCHNCGREMRCPSRCVRREQWFRTVWRELRAMYLGPDHARR